MRICILGPCGGGKTTWSRKMAKRFKVKAYNLDDIFVDYKNITPSRVAFYPRKIIERGLKAIINKKSWIVEGIYVEREILERSDVVVLICRPYLFNLFWQWKRYFTDKQERERFGLRQNLALSVIVWNQYFSNRNFFRCVGYDYPTMHYYTEVLTEYQDKVFLFSWFGEELFFGRIKKMLK